jgi:hypothetical protein
MHGPVYSTPATDAASIGAGRRPTLRACQADAHKAPRRNTPANMLLIQVASPDSFKPTPSTAVARSRIAITVPMTLNRVFTCVDPSRTTEMTGKRNDVPEPLVADCTWAHQMIDVIPAMNDEYVSASISIRATLIPAKRAATRLLPVRRAYLPDGVRSSQNQVRTAQKD